MAIVQAANDPFIIFTLLKTFDVDLVQPKVFDFKQLQPFFFTGKEIQHFTNASTNASSTTTVGKSTNASVGSNVKTNAVVHLPKKHPFQGSLFQCILFSLQGKSCDIREEIHEKQNIVTALANSTLDKKVLKSVPYRITKAELEEIISDLITLSIRKHEYNSCFGMVNLNLLQAILYSHYYKKNICLFSREKKVYVDFRVNDSFSCLYFQFKNGYLFEVCEQFPDLSSMVKAETPTSLLKSISNYKLAELKDLFLQLNGEPLPENAKKQTLFEALQHRNL